MLQFTKILRPVISFKHCATNPRCISSICPSPKEPIVTLLDASSTVGLNLALLLKQNTLIKELRIYDEQHDTLPLMYDLCCVDTKTEIKHFPSNRIRAAIEGASIVISTGGCQSKAGETQKNLFEKNLDNVRNAALYLSEFNPKAIFCIAKPPVEALVPMVAEEFKKSESYDPKKIIGVTTPVSMIANTFIAHHLNKDPASVLCPIIGGMSPKTSIPVISQTRPNVEYNSKLYSQLQETIACAEENLLAKDATFCYSKVVAISRFVNLILKALKGDGNCVECAFVPQTGHIGEFLPYMTSIVKLGPEGITSTHMPRMNELETTRLKAAAPHIMENILIGQTFLNGDYDLPFKLKPKKGCDEMLKKKIQESNRLCACT